jgi:lysozyme
LIHDRRRLLGLIWEFLRHSSCLRLQWLKATVSGVVLFILIPSTEGQTKDRGFPVVDTPTEGIFLDDYSFPKTRGPLRQLPSAGLSLTKRSEGFRGFLYEDAARYCTIAYGHLVKRAPCDGSEPEEFRVGMSKPAGSALLRSDMQLAQQAVAALVKKHLTDGAYGAVCDFVYNVGPTNFGRSTLLDAINHDRIDDIPIQFRRWIKAGGKELVPLKTRREREITLYFGKPQPQPPATKAGQPAGSKPPTIDIRTGER